MKEKERVWNSVDITARFRRRIPAPCRSAAGHNAFVAGLLTGIAFSILSIGIGALLIGGLVRDLPVGAKLGLCGAIGLGAVGLETFFWGVFGWLHLNWLFYAFWLIAGLAGWFINRRLLWPFGVCSPEGKIFLFALGILLLIRLPAVLAPSDAGDWDSISHQMAMSKIWLDEGRLTHIPFMHQSNIPATINMLYVWGLDFGGQQGAKAFSWMFAVFAVMAIGGLTAFRYGARAGYWAALAFAVTPVVLWEAGTAYIDVAHGLFSGVAILCAVFLVGESATPAAKRWLLLGGISLGLAIGTKYTAFQIGLAIGVVLVIYGIVNRQPKRALVSAFAIGGIAMAIASPWYIRNVVNTGNPVYPFYYSIFGGSNWSEENSHAYAQEQARFGIGQKIDDKGEFDGKNLIALPGSVTALAIQPEKQFFGFVFLGSVGPLFLTALLFWLLSGRMRREEGAAVAIICLSLLTWFFLTQQSRYIIALMVPGAFLLGGAVARLSLGWLAAAGVFLQAVWTLVLFGPAVSPLSEQVDVALGRATEDAFLTNRLPFWEAAKHINEIGKLQRGMKVALYDEVFGFYLDVDYLWANPAHHTLIPYGDLKASGQLIDELLRIGVTHVYINLAPRQSAWLRSRFFPRLFDDTVQGNSAEPFRNLLWEAYDCGELRMESSFGRGRGVLLEIVQGM